MPHNSRSEVLAEAAGVKIVTSSPEEDANTLTPGKMILRMQRINEASDHSLGFHLTRSRWDPFPWVSYVENGSLADSVGLRTGDCLLSVDGIDLVGLKVADVATLIRKEEGDKYVNIAVWRCPPQDETQDNVGLALKGPLPDVAKNLVHALSGTVRALECPICLETAAPPVSQCVHGHILCTNCRPKMTRCPICRVQLAHGRCLLADNLHRVLRDTYFDVKKNQTTDKSVASNHHNLCHQLFGKNKKQEETLAVTRNRRSMSKPKQFLLARLLLGGREKAVSADNLTRMSEIGEETAAVTRRAAVVDNLLGLSMNDRAKSASTGELSRNNQIIDSTMSSSQIARSSCESAIRHASQHSLHLLQMAIFSSTDSVSISLACPLLRYCDETVCSQLLFEHIKSHQVPQIHFYTRNATIPLPIPFGYSVFYIFHYDGYMFFFQCIKEEAWMTTTMTNNEMQWALHGWDECGSQVNFRRCIASLESPVTLSSEHVAPVSKLLKSINVRIVNDRRVYDDFGI